MPVQYDYAKTCIGRNEPGTKQLETLLLRLFPGTRTAGIYNCRTVRGGKSTSLHAEGRAVDLWITSIAQGDALAKWARDHSEQYQIQEVIWNRKIWSVLHANAGWRKYTGENQHTDHVHIGQNRKGARMHFGIPAAAASPSLAVTPSSSNLWTILLVSGLAYVVWNWLE